MEAKPQLKYRTYQFSVKIIDFCSKLPDKKIFWIINDQLLRAATSVGANIVEAQAGSSKRDFIEVIEVELP